MTRILLVLLTMSLFSIELMAQTPQKTPKTAQTAPLGALTIDGGIDASVAVKDFLFGGDCFDVANVIYKGNSGQIGSFSMGTNAVGIDQGMVITTGYSYLAAGINDVSDMGVQATGSTADADLSLLSGSSLTGPQIPLFDAYYVEFDITPTGNQVSFQYVWASEEYCERGTNPAFDDRFCILMKGPGVSGPINGFANLSQIPPVGLGAGGYVGTFTLNNSNNKNLFINNMPAGLNNCQPIPNATGPAIKELQFDGKSVVLTAAATVIPCSTYHVKIKIADGGDATHDSGVFIRVATGNAAGDKALVEQAVDDDFSNNVAIEGCDQAKFVFERPGGAPTNTPLVVNYTISGTATPGVDYTALPPSITIPANQTMFTLPVNILNDAIVEGTENIKLTLAKPCSCTKSFGEIFINDYIPLQIIADTTERCGPGVITLEPTVLFGDDPYFYKWSNGATTSSITLNLNQSATYKVTVTDDCGKTITANMAAKIRKIPTAMTSGTAYFCQSGTQKATMTINLTGEGPWTVEYSVNNDDYTISGITKSPYKMDVFEPGIYLLKAVYDGGLCDGPVSGAFTVLFDDIEMMNQSSNVRCYGENNGSINTTLLQGSPQFHYNWSPPLGDVADPTGLAPGFYKLTVTDSKACTAKDSFNITQPPLISVAVSNIVEAKCSDPNGGSIALTASGGIGNKTYFWSNGQTTATATGLAAGSYTATVTDETGCTKTITATVSGDFQSPTASAQANGQVTCGNQNVQLTSNGSSSGGNFTYQWSGGPINGPTNQATATAIASGNYLLVVTNTNNGCTASATATVGGNVILPNATAAVSGEINCLNSTVSLSGNGSSTGGNFTYDWSGPGLVGATNGISASANLAGMYQILVTNTQTGCINTAQTTVVLNQTAPSAVVASPSNLNCHTTQIVLNGNGSSSGPNFSYNWTTTNGSILNNGSTLNPTVGSVGNYSLLVTNNQNGCTATTSTQVNATTPPTASISASQNATCFGTNTGSATVAAALGSGNFQFLWSNGQTTATASGLAAGNFSVTATDSDGCTATATVSISQPTQLAATATQSGETIVGATDGTATALPTGGTTPYLYAWSNGGTTATISWLSPGNYSATVTDAHGCSTVVSIAVQPAPCQLLIQIFTENTVCNGGTGGSALVNLTNETAPVTYHWSDGQTGGQAVDLAAGSISVTATDGLGCTISATVVVGQPDPISILESHVDVACFDDSTGVISVVAGGGVGNFSYVWSTGATNSSISMLPPGLYSVTATDGNGCMKASFISISSNDITPPTLILKTPTVAIDDNGKATLTAALFDNGSSDNCGITSWTVNPPFFNCTELGLRDVSISATDASGNTSIQVAQVNIVDTKPPVLTCPSNKFYWSCAPNVTYQYPVAIDNCLGNGGQFALVSGLPSGLDYPTGVTTNVFTYTDAGGNVGTCSFDVTVWPLADDAATYSLPLCSGDCNGSIKPELTAGAGPYSFAWSNSQTTQTASNLCAGIFVVTITDGGGCTSVHTLTLNDHPQLAATVSLKKDDIGNAGIGQITVVITGGVLPYSFNWTKNGAPFSTNQNLTGLFMGNYQLSVTDANGCLVATESIQIDNLIGTSEPSWASGLQLVPNPTTGETQLVFNEKTAKNLQIEVSDASGRLIETLRFDGSQTKFNLDFGKWPDGVYNLRIRLEGESVARRLVILK